MTNNFRNLMQWVADRKAGAMDAIMLGRATTLREQMDGALSKKQKKRGKKKARKAAASRL